ncbi:MAG: lamin tail domain-containing protein [Tenericutes bacterium]|nr:lamin tail domain-containing protein [Mycoplasmatota bacterium]
MRKVFGIALMALLGLFLVACVEDTTTTATTTAAQTTAGVTTVAPTTVAPTTVAPTTVAPVDLATLIDNLKTQYATTLEDVNFLATENLTLVATVSDFAITWTSSNATYLENDGTIHRPSYTTGNQTVVLTASVTDGTDTESYGFFVTVKALDKTDLERANEVFLVVTAFPSKEKWTVADEATLEFLTTGKDADDVDYTVVWTSSLPANLSIDGDIVQPMGADVVVTMTATITINGVDFTKDVVFTIAKIEAATVVTTIAAAAVVGAGEYVQITGVTVTDIDSSGNVFFTDGTDLLYVYSPTFVVAVGDVIDVTGEFTYYYNSPQLQGTTEHPLVAVASTVAAVAAPVNTPASLIALISGLTQPSTDNPWAYEYYEVTAKIYVNEDWGNYSVFLVPLDYDFSAALADGATQPNGDCIMIYYKSNMDVLSTLHQKEVTLTILTQGYRTDKSVYYANFFGTAENLSVVFADDATAVAAALASVMYPAEIVENTTLDMFASVYGVALTFASDNAVVIDPATGMVDLSTLTTQVDVTITVTATKGSVIDTKTIVITVGVLPLSTAAEAQALADGTKVMIQGIVIADEYYNTYMIQDATGGISIYTSNTTLETFLQANIGNKVELIGNRASYHGLLQVTPDTITLVEVSTLPAATNLDAVDEADFIDYQNMLVEFTDLYVLSVDANDGGYGNFYGEFVRLSDGAIIQMKWDSRITLSTAAAAALSGLAVGDKVTIAAGLGWYDGARFFMTDTTVITEGTPYTDAELLAVDAAKFEAAVTITTDYMLPDLAYATGTTVAIATELQAYLVDALTASNSLTVTLPNGDVTGNVTFTLTLNAATLDVVVAITLDGMTDAEKLAADQASLEVELTAFAQQTVELPLMGELGSTVVWTVVSGAATLDVDGKTLVFDAAAADADVVLQASLTIGAEVAVTKDFTVAVTGYTVTTDFSGIYTQTVADVWDVADGVTVYIQGVVSAKGYNALYLADANGVGVKISGNTFGDLAVGDEIIVVGVLEASGGVRQLDWNPVVVKVVSSANAVTATLMTADQVIALTAADSGKLITISSVEFKTAGGYPTFIVRGTGETSIEISGHSSNFADWVFDAFEEGDMTGEFTFIFSKFYNSDLSVEVVTIEQREVDKVNADAAQLPATLTLLDEDFVLPTALYGSTFTVTAVSAEITAYIDETTTPGTLIILSNPAVAAVGTVTIEVMQGATTVSVDIAVTVDALAVVEPVSDLFISEYADGSSSNKYLEIYNPTNETIDLSIYKVVLYSNGATEPGNTTVLTGTLAPGEVYVVYNSGAVATITDAGDIASTVTYFNGDDCVVLTKNDVIIDILLSVGHTNNEYVIDDMTLIRNSNITGPSTTFDINDWTEVTQDDWTDLGTHTMDVPAPTELFISEYADGSSSNKYLEIYNPTNETIDLSIYKVVLYSNGATEPGNTTVLTGTLAPGEVYVVYNSGAVATITDAGDIASTVTYFNGDDCVVLTKNDVIIDILLSVGHTNNEYVIDDMTLIRNSNITGPSTTFDINDWTEVTQDDWTDLGTHTID